MSNSRRFTDDELKTFVMAQMNAANPVLMPHHIQEEWFRFKLLTEQNDNPEAAVSQAIKVAGWLLRYAWENGRVWTKNKERNP